MPERDEAIERFEALEPSQFGVIDTWMMTQKAYSGNPTGFYLDLWLRPSWKAKEDLRRLHLVFTETHKMECEMPSYGEHIQLEIELKEYTEDYDAQYRQDLKYYVSETTRNALHLYCASFEAHIEELAQ